MSSQLIQQDIQSILARQQELLSSLSVIREKIRSSSRGQRENDNLSSPHSQHKTSSILTPLLIVSEGCLRRYRPFTISLSGPTVWFKRNGVRQDSARSLGEQITVVKMFNKMEAHGCRCKREGSLLTVMFAEKETPKLIDKVLFNVSECDGFTKYTWEDCRFHCATSKTHYASDLCFALEINGNIIYSRPFSSQRMTKDKNRTVDAFGTALQALVAQKPERTVEGRVVAAQFSLLFHFHNIFKEEHVILLLELLRDRGLISYRAQKMGEFFCLMLSFDSISNAQSCINDYVVYLRNKGFVPNRYKKDVISSFAVISIGCFANWETGISFPLRYPSKLEISRALQELHPILDLDILSWIPDLKRRTPTEESEENERPKQRARNETEFNEITTKQTLQSARMRSTAPAKLERKSHTKQQSTRNRNSINDNLRNRNTSLSSPKHQTQTLTSPTSPKASTDDDDVIAVLGLGKIIAIRNFCQSRRTQQQQQQQQQPTLSNTNGPPSPFPMIGTINTEENEKNELPSISSLNLTLNNNGCRGSLPSITSVLGKRDNNSITQASM